MPSSTSRRIAVVGGGIAGLAVSVRLAQAGLPVTLFESSELGHAASTRNQGWLHSGGMFAVESVDYARMCHESLQETLRFCGDCVEPQVPPMAYLFSRPDTLVTAWTSAWTAAGIPAEEISIASVRDQLPGVAGSRIQHAFQLPDRAIRTDVLLEHLAATARNAGVEIRTGTHVSRLEVCDGRACGVVTSVGESISAQLVILSGGASGFDLFRANLQQQPGSQLDVEPVCLKRRLIALRNEIGRLPFCIVDADRLNHLPHPPASVFGVELWDQVRTPDDRPDPRQDELIRRRIGEFFPKLALTDDNLQAWTGTNIQALRSDQVEPGTSLWPAVIDHARQQPRIANLVSIFPGRATLWGRIAEEARQAVLAKLSSSSAGTAHPPWMNL